MKAQHRALLNYASLAVVVLAAMYLLTSTTREMISELDAEVTSTADLIEQKTRNSIQIRFESQAARDYYTKTVKEPLAKLLESTLFLVSFQLTGDV